MSTLALLTVSVKEVKTTPDKTPHCLDLFGVAGTPGHAAPRRATGAREANPNPQPTERGRVDLNPSGAASLGIHKGRVE